MSESTTVRKKILLVGDGGCGKTCLLAVFAENRFPETHIPTIYETYLKEIVVDEKHFTLFLSDTAGEEDYDRLRPLSYVGTDIVIICFAIDNPASLENVRLKWYPEVKHFLPKAYRILVGTKLDMRCKEGVSVEQGTRVSRKIQADKYMECSAKYSLGVRQIFEAGVRMSLNPKKTSLVPNCCII